MNQMGPSLLQELMHIHDAPRPSPGGWPKAIAVTGALGSGKTEWVLNLALGFQSRGEEVTIADMDIINPYFCIRQVSSFLGRMGFQVLTPPENARWSDMSVISPEVARALGKENGRLLLDIGGDAEGALALKQFQPDIARAGYLLVLVVNAFRPQTSSTAGIGKMLRKMEETCGLKVGALVSNSHLMEETTPEDCLAGLATVRAAGAELGLPVLFAGILPKLFDETSALFAARGMDTPLWPMYRYMMRPWEDGALWSRGPDPAARMD